MCKITTVTFIQCNQEWRPGVGARPVHPRRVLQASLPPRGLVAGTLYVVLNHAPGDSEEGCLLGHLGVRDLMEEDGAVTQNPV